MLLVRSTLKPTRSAALDGHGWLRPISIAGVLWLLIAALFGLGAGYLVSVAPFVALFYAVPAALLASFGIGLITRRGIGLPILSLILGTVLATLGTLGVLGLDGGSTDDTGAALTAVYGGVIAVSSVVGVWIQGPSHRESAGGTDGLDHHPLRSRILTGVMVAYVIIGTLILLGPFVFVLLWIGLSSLTNPMVP
jgi:hypothetical protein